MFVCLILWPVLSVLLLGARNQPTGTPRLGSAKPDRVRHPAGLPRDAVAGSWTVAGEEDGSLLYRVCQPRELS